MNYADYFELIEADLRAAHATDLRRRRRSLVTGATGLATAAAVAASLVVGPGPDGNAGGPLAVAAARAADRANPFTAGLSIETLSMATTATRTGGYSALVDERETLTRGADGQIVIVRRSSGQFEFPSPRDRVRWEQDGRPPLATEAEERQTVQQAAVLGALGPAASLPADPTRLASVLHQAAASASDPAAERLVLACDILAEPAVAPAVRSATLEALQTDPGLRVTEDARDSTGRHGVAVSATSSMNGDRTTRIVLIDPQTTTPISDETRLDEVVPWTGAPVGTPIASRRFSVGP